MKTLLIIALFVAGLIVLALVISLLGGCAWDMYHNRDGSKKHPLATDTADPPAQVEMPKPKGQ